MIPPLLNPGKRFNSLHPDPKMVLNILVQIIAVKSASLKYVKGLSQNQLSFNLMGTSSTEALDVLNSW